MCLDNTVGHYYSFVDMVAYMIGTYQFVDACVFEHFPHVRVNSGEHYMDSVLYRRLDKELEIMHSGCIDKRNFTHTDNANERLIGH